MKKFLPLLLPLLLLCAETSAQSIIPRWMTTPASETVLIHEGFTVSYNHDTLTPNWSAWDITPERLATQVTGRTDFFTTDPDCPDPQAEYRDYSNNTYHMDRGHMAPSADFTWSKNANEQTFYLTNICPQRHELNEGLWLELEQRCRSYAKLYKTTVHVVCGPVYDSAHVYIKGKNKVEIPDAFFKAILFTKDGKTFAAAFIIPNEPVDVQQDIFDYLVPLQAVTNQTGLIPFPDTKYLERGKAMPFDIPWKKPNKK